MEDRKVIEITVHEHTQMGLRASKVLVSIPAHYDEDEVDESDLRHDGDVWIADEE